VYEAHSSTYFPVKEHTQYKLCVCYTSSAFMHNQVIGAYAEPETRLRRAGET